MKKFLLIFAMTFSLFASNQVDTNVTDKILVNDATAFSFGNSDKEIVIITDPECPFCRKLSKDKLKKFPKYNIRILLVALPYHKEAKQMISYILSGKTNEEKLHRYKEITIGGDISYKEFETNSKLVDDYLEKSMKVVKSLGVNRVPSLFENIEDDYFSTTYDEM